MLVIGLTGPTGAGKGEVAALFRAHGLPVIDADAVYHALLIPPSPCLDELCVRFGRDILRTDGTLDRQRLGAIVFSDADALSDLNAIAHRYVMADIRGTLKKWQLEKIPAAVIDAPQLFEAHADLLCNAVVSVLADRNLRMERIMARDGIDAERALKRINAQKSDDYFRTNSDYVIENNASAEHLAPHVRRILLEMGVILS